MRLARNFFAFTAAIVLCTTASTALLAVQPGEYQVKAAFLYNFAKFAEWPGTAANRAGPLSICVLGQDPFGPSLDAALTGEIRGQQVVARRITKMQDGQDCSMVFISASEERRLGDVLKTLERNAVLTVSDISGFSRRGGMIQFVFEGNRIRFEVNLASAQNAGIQLSSELLKIATSVRRS